MSFVVAAIQSTDLSHEPSFQILPLCMHTCRLLNLILHVICMFEVCIRGIINRNRASNFYMDIFLSLILPVLIIHVCCYCQPGHTFYYTHTSAQDLFTYFTTVTGLPTVTQLPPHTPFHSGCRVHIVIRLFLCQGFLIVPGLTGTTGAFERGF